MASEYIDKVCGFFGEDSPMTKASSEGGMAYEDRPQQKEMSRCVAEALEGAENLCIEAPTGVGKSFAYLVPALYFALRKKARVVISTETISLQEQLVLKDIPMIKKLTGEDFLAVIAKGRSNYLCLRRLALTAGEHGADFLPLDSLLPRAVELQNLSKTLVGGSRTDIPFDIDGRIWENVCCELGNCMAQKCEYYGRCFYWKARRSWEKADIIVANHALLFTDIRIRELDDSDNSLLPKYDALVFDEAHMLEDCAANHLGLKVSHVGLKHLLGKLFDPERGKGMLICPGEDSMSMRSVVSDAYTASEIFFSGVADRLEGYESQEMRIYEESRLDGGTVSVAMNNLEARLSEYVRGRQDELFRQELAAMQIKCAACNKDMQDFLGLRRPDHVYWIERKTGRGNITLHAAPLNVAEVLRKILFSADFSVILTSATLSVDGKLDYYRERTGFSGGQEVVLDSPFDYDRQMRIYVSGKLPLPESEHYETVLKDNIMHFVDMTGGKAFVLFTSYGLLNKMADSLRESFISRKIKLLIQGESGNRTAMLDEFRRDVNSVLFGTSSFWMGVDVPGESLSNVIITKLPFAVPSHPLIQARSEKISGSGRSPFMHYQLPEAVLRFKQGVGRLIRSKEDNGIIVILDSRVQNKHYGKIFINSVPKCPLVRF